MADPTISTEYQKDIWVKYEILPGLEINVRRYIEEREGKKIFEIAMIAKSIIKEGKND